LELYRKCFRNRTTCVLVAEQVVESGFDARQCGISHLSIVAGWASRWT